MLLRVGTGPECPEGVAFQAPPGSQASARGEAKDSARLSSRDAGLLEPPKISSLRLLSGHSGLVLTLSNAVHTSLSSPCLLVVDTSVHAIRRGEGAQRKLCRDPRCCPRGKPGCRGTYGAEQGGMGCIA